MKVKGGLPNEVLLPLFDSTERLTSHKKGDQSKKNTEKMSTPDAQVLRCDCLRDLSWEKEGVQRNFIL